MFVLAIEAVKGDMVDTVDMVDIVDMVDTADMVDTTAMVITVHMGQVTWARHPSTTQSTCPLGCLLMVAGHLQDVLEEGGDVDPLAKLRDGISSQLEVPENSD